MNDPSIIFYCASFVVMGCGGGQKFVVEIQPEISAPGRNLWSREAGVSTLRKNYSRNSEVLSCSLHGDQHKRMKI
jgi:hypothetical protein